MHFSFLSRGVGFVARLPWQTYHVSCGMIVVYRYTFLFEKKILVSRHTFLNRFYLRLSSCVTRVAIVTIGFPKKKKGVFHFVKTPIIIPATKLTLLIISSSGFSPNKLGLGFFGSILRSLSWTSIWKWGPWRYSARPLLSNVPRRTTFTSSQKTSLPCSLPALSCKGCS